MDLSLIPLEDLLHELGERYVFVMCIVRSYVLRRFFNKLNRSSGGGLTCG